MFNIPIKGVLVCTLILFVLSQHASADNILVTVHPGASQWWYALAVSDNSIVKVETKDSSDSAQWTALARSNWGYWVYITTGVPAVYPISVRVSSTAGSLVFDNVITSNDDAGKTFNTHSNFPSGSPTVAPTIPDATKGDVVISQSAVNTWSGGAQYSVVIKNNGAKALTGISFTSTQTFVSLWGVSRNDNTFGFPDYVSSIAAGASYAFGYVVNGDGSPATFSITSTSFGDGGSTPTEGPTSTPSTQAPATEAPATEAPSTEAPATDAPATQAPATDAPATDAPVTQAPTTTPPAKSTSPPVTPSTPNHGTSGEPITVTGNPFVGAAFYSPPYYSAQVQSAITANPGMTTLSSLLSVPVTFWLDKIEKVSTLSAVLTSARGQQTTTGSPVIVTLIIYDLPSRDCAALASNGEIPCADSSCADGIERYKTSYIDPIVEILKGFQDLRIAAIVEPDSLPNLVTNLGVPKCTASITAYKTCVAYAIEKISTQPNIAIYVDAAHGGWMGWPDNLAGIATIFAEVLTMAGGASKIRGFSTNVANYQPLGSLTDDEDPCGLKTQYNFAYNEVSYTKLLGDALSTAGVTGKTFIIDTSRNGVPGARSSCSNWCNINKAGLGVRPTASPANLGVDNIDALLWVKPPGESDGTSDSSAARYDAHCSSSDSVTPAPEAGQWFPSYFTMLAQNANPPL